MIILLTIGGAFLLACFYAYPRGLVTRTIVFAGTTLLYAAVALTLLLMPRDDGPEDDSSGKVTDSSTIGRVTLMCVSVLFCLGGLGCVMVSHVMAPQKAPLIKAPAEEVEAYRYKA